MKTKAVWIRRLAILGMVGLLFLVGCGGAGSAVNNPPAPPTPSPGSSALSISSISPTSAVAGSPNLPLTVTGSNFTSAPHKVNQMVWSVNGRDTSLATTFISSTQLTAVIPAALLTNPVTAKVFVEIWDIMGDAPEATSNSVSFSVTSNQTGIPVTLLIGDTPPPGVTVLSFSLRITGAVLFNDPVDPDDQGTPILQNPVAVELSRLQADTALLASVSVPPRSYRFLFLTFANPVLTILNNTGVPIGSCANGAICKSKPVLSVSSVLLSASVGQSPLLLDFDLSNSLSTDMSSINPVVIVRQLGAPVATTIARLKQASGIVSKEGGDGADGFFYTVTTDGGALQFDDNDTHYVDAGAPTCRFDFGDQFYCLDGQRVEVDSRILAPLAFEARTVTVIPSAQNELEGLMIAVNGINQFDMIVLHETPDVAGVEVDDLVRVNLLPGATIEAADTDLKASGLLFSAPTDFQVGQVIRVRLQSEPSGTPLAVAADRVRLKSSAFTGRVKSLLNATDFLVDNLPGYLTSGQIQVRTNARTDLISLSSIANLKVGDTLSLSGFLLKGSDPVLLAEAVRKR